MRFYVMNICLTLGLLSAGSALLAKDHEKKEVSSPSTYSLLFTGDLHFGELYQQQYARRPDRENILETKGRRYTLSGVESFLKHSDAIVANLESPVTRMARSPWHKAKKYLHRENPLYLKPILQAFPFQVLSLANNHTLDFGVEGLQDSLKHLDDFDMPTIGAGSNLERAHRPHFIDFKVGKHKVQIAVFAAFEYRKSYAEMYHYYSDDRQMGVVALNNPRILESIKAVKKADPRRIIMVYPHWGPNYRWKTKKQLRWSKRLIRAGADMIIGHGAHCLQEVSIFRRRLTAFSLGNFVFNASGRYELLQAPPYSLVAQFVFSLDVKGRLQRRLKLYPIASNNRTTGYKPRPVNKTEFLDIIKMLAEKDPKGHLMRDALLGHDDLGHFLVFTLGAKLHVRPGANRISDVGTM